MFRRPILALLALACVSGCTRMRFVVDTAPTDEELTESVVDRDRDAGWFADKVALIDVRGLLADAPRWGLLSPGENPVARFSESLRRAADDSAVRAVILRVNSPGGTVTASDVMYREVQRFRAQTRKPVVVLMADVAASGGYYVACAGDRIIAHPTTVTGSIGVIIQTINFAEGMRRIGIRADAITSGPNKSMGSPFEPMPPEHRDLLQGLVNEFHGNFTAMVLNARPGLKAEDLIWIMDGRVISGARAAEVGVVDALGDLHDAFDEAKRLAAISSARLVKYHRPIEHVASPYAAAPTMPSGSLQLNLLQLNLDASDLMQQPGFYYLWDPVAWQASG